MKMKSVFMANVACLLMAGTLQAEVIFTADGFESPAYANGTVAGKKIGSAVWAEWDAVLKANNGNRDLTVVQSSTAKNGSQALAIADSPVRVIARVAGLKITDAVSYWDAWYKTEAQNDPGIVRIILRYNSASGAAGVKAFELNTKDGRPSLMDRDNTAQRGEIKWGEWIRVTIEARLAENAYKLYIDGKLAFEGTLAAGDAPKVIIAWEVDVDASDPKREPKGAYSVYVDDLVVQTTNPIE